MAVFRMQISQKILGRPAIRTCRACIEAVLCVIGYCNCVKTCSDHGNPDPPSRHHPCFRRDIICCVAFPPEKGGRSLLLAAFIALSRFSSSLSFSRLSNKLYKLDKRDKLKHSVMEGVFRKNAMSPARRNANPQIRNARE